MTKRIITTILYVVLFFNLIEAKDISTNTVTNTSLALPDKIEFVAYPDTGTNVYLLLDGSREKLAEFKKTTSYFDLERGWLSTIEKTKAIPQTTYTLYQDFFRTGTRYRYEAEYFQKRNVMTSLAMLVLLEHGNVQENIDKLCDYLWNICEETTWVLPAHYARQDVDLFASETAQALAEIVTTLEDKLPKDVKTRVKSEIYRRVLDPYLDHYKKFWWYKGTNNWNGVCNGAIGSTFVLLETDTVRLENAVRTVVTGLDTYITKGFNNDGGTTEGVPYWMFGMGNYIMFADLLYQRTGGKVDILSSNKLKAIAKYPLSMAMGPAQVASFSDSGDSIRLPHGMIKRLSERTACPELLTFLDNKNFVTERVSYPKVLRNIFWWDYNTIPQDFIVNDLMLPQTGVVKLVNTSTSAGNIILVLSAKAGHNAESHNHNDIGSFILRVNGETILCDPGSGLYDKDYFSGKRYNNVFANSYGHSVPVINGKLQSPGLKFYGK
ncbi:MAG: heparinase II/III family protein, partial [Elusimicrobiota bacterium]